MTVPRVTIGLPVYNGEEHLAETLESIIAQSHDELQLIVSDNASTDATGEIARAVAERDERVHYQCHHSNVGANANYNCLVAFADDAPYFKWAAHDDVLEPDYLARCVARLEERPEVVGCHARTRLIDGSGHPLVRTGRAWVSREGVFARTDPPTYIDGLRARDPATRFRAAIRHKALNGHIFSVFRTAALVRTGLQLPFYGADRVLVAELALHGPLDTVDAELSLRRAHPATSMAIASWAERNRWAAPGTSATLYPLVMGRGYAGAIRRAPLTRRDRLRCGAVLLGKAIEPGSLRRLLPGRHSFWRHSAWPPIGRRARRPPP